jgi:hypothetical protein
VGPFIPEVDLWWLIIVATLAFLWIKPSTTTLRLRAAAAVALLLILSALPLSVWFLKISSSSVPKQALASRVSQSGGESTEPVLMSSLQIDERKYLNRLVGRRRDVRLVLSGFLYVPRPGPYRFELDCDDRCNLFVHGDEILTDRAGTREKHLEQGFHPFKLEYEQDGGPAHLSVGWDGPKWVELLPLDHYVADRLDGLREMQRKARVQVSTSLVLNILWWIVGLGLGLRIMEWARFELSTAPLRDIGENKRRSAMALVCSLLCALVVPVLDLTFLGFPNRRALPSFSGSELLRSILLVGSAVLFVYAFHIQGADRKSPVTKIGILARKDRLFAATRWPLLAFATALPWVHVWSPEHFSRLGREDGIVENLSALLVLAASVVSLFAAWRVFRSRERPQAIVLLLVGLSGVFFLIGMEEISWGQRIVGFESPSFFRENLQGEANIHNFATDAFEDLYYSLAAVLLIVLPFVQDRTNAFTSFPTIGFFIPSLSIVFLSAPLAAYNCNLWTTPHIQLSFFLTVAILLYYLLQVWKDRAALYFYVLVLTVVLTQAVFLIKGGFPRFWGLTEYKEFFIPLGFLLYSTDLFHRTREESSKNWEKNHDSTAQRR